MTRQLLVLRHAQSSPGAIPDHRRPLDERGREDARRVGRLIVELKLEPQQALCSTATRAEETLDLLLPAFSDCDVVRTKALYLCPAGQIVELLRNIPDRRTRVLVVGHNPGVEELVAGLTGERVSLRPAALAALRLAAAWRELAAGAAQLAGLWDPGKLWP